MEDNKREIEDSKEKIIRNICAVLLTYQDFVSVENGIKFINNLKAEDFELIKSVKDDDDKFIHNLLFCLVGEYIQNYQNSFSEEARQETLFSFSSANSLVDFRKKFKAYYLSREQDDFPFLFNCIFDYIQEMCEHYRLFQSFYNVSSEETQQRILSDVEKTAKDETEKAIGNTIKKEIDNFEEFVNNKINEARVQAQVAVNEAKRASDEAKGAAEKEAEIAVNKKMIDVTSKVSESSVTILGIFSGIVLTVVAGLFYSSSVLESVNSANLFRLICIISFVGLVCYHLIALMFRSIEKIKNSKVRLSTFSCSDIIFTIIFLTLAIAGAILQFIIPDKNVNISPEETPSPTTIEIFVSQNETTTVSETTELVTEISTTETTTK